MPNQPYLDATVQWKIRTGNLAFHEPGYREVADAILETGLATQVVRRIGSGKEADVYLAQDNARPVAVKVYRLYRTTHRGGGPVKAETMGHRASREFELLTYAWQDGAPVPRPYRRDENMFAMEYLGGPDGPAPMLHHASLEAPGAFCAATLRGIERLAEAGVVHSDLSPFNILVHQAQPRIIDLAACHRVDRLGASPWVRLTEATEAMRRGLGALRRYFERYGETFDVEELTDAVARRLDRFGVLEG